MFSCLHLVEWKLFSALWNSSTEVCNCASSSSQLQHRFEKGKDALPTAVSQTGLCSGLIWFFNMTGDFQQQLSSHVEDKRRKQCLSKRRTTAGKTVCPGGRQQRAATVIQRRRSQNNNGRVEVTRPQQFHPQFYGTVKGKQNPRRAWAEVCCIKHPPSSSFSFPTKEHVEFEISHMQFYVNDNERRFTRVLFTKLCFLFESLFLECHFSWRYYWPHIQHLGGVKWVSKVQRWNWQCVYCWALPVRYVIEIRYLFMLLPVGVRSSGAVLQRCVAQPCVVWIFLPICCQWVGTWHLHQDRRS